MTREGYVHGHTCLSLSPADLTGTSFPHSDAVLYAILLKISSLSFQNLTITYLTQSLQFTYFILIKSLPELSDEPVTLTTSYASCFLSVMYKLPAAQYSVRHDSISCLMSFGVVLVGLQKGSRINENSSSQRFCSVNPFIF